MSLQLTRTFRTLGLGGSALNQFWQPGSVDGTPDPAIPNLPLQAASKGVANGRGYRQNLLVNATFTGGTPGTPGTMPTGWNAYSGGISQQIVGFGKDGVYDYIDIRWFGTNSSGSVTYPQISWPTGSNGAGGPLIPAGERIAAKALVKLVAGAATGFTNIYVGVNQFTLAQSYVTGTTDNYYTGSENISSWTQKTASSIAAVDTRAAFQLGGQVANGVTVDVTLRIAWPSIERGVFTTPLPATAVDNEVLTYGEGSALATGVGSAAGVGTATGSSIPKHRRWRMNVTATQGAGVAKITEMEMYESADGPNLAPLGTTTTQSYITGGFEGTKLTDGEYYKNAFGAVNRWMSDFDGPPWWAQVDFGAGNEKAIKCIGLHAPDASNCDGMPASFDVQWSDDGSTWTTEWSVTGVPSWSAGEFRRFYKTTPTYTGSPYGTHDYWRIYTRWTEEASSAWVHIAEAEFLDGPGGTDQATGGTATPDNYGGREAYKAFDDDPSTQWTYASQWGWLQYAFAVPVSVGAVSITGRPDAGADNAPRDFLIQFSDDGTTWATAWGVIGQTGWSLGERREFTDPAFVSSSSVGSAAGVGSATGTGIAAAIGVGSADGVGAANGVGIALFRGVGSAAGVGAASGVGSALGTGVGSAATGAGAAAGEGKSPAVGVGSAAGVGAASGEGKSNAVGIGSAAGVGAASGVGSALGIGVGSAAGVGAANGAGQSGASVGSASGTGTATGVGQSTAVAVGSASGTGTATGVGLSASTGAAAGVGAANGVGIALVTGVGSASGVGAASGVGIALFAGVGSASGVGAAAATGSSTAASAASAAGVGAANGVGASLARSTGSADGVGTATGLASAGAAVGSASGTGTASGAGQAIIAAVGSAAGAGAASGAGKATVISVGAATGVGGLTGVGVALFLGVGAAPGAGAASGVGKALGMGVGAAAGAGVAAGVGRVIAVSVGDAPGVGDALGEGKAQARSVGVAAGVGAAFAASFSGRQIVQSWIIS